MPTVHLDDLEEVARGGAVPVDKVVVREVRMLPEQEQGRYAHAVEGRWSPRQLAVRGHHGRLAVAVAPAPVRPCGEMHGQLVLEQVSRRSAERALVVAQVDRLREGAVDRSPHAFSAA